MTGDFVSHKESNYNTRYKTFTLDTQNRTFLLLRRSASVPFIVVLEKGVTSNYKVMWLEVLEIL